MSQHLFRVSNRVTYFVSHWLAKEVTQGRAHEVSILWRD